MIVKGVNLETVYGVIIQDGAFNQLWKLPTRKVGYAKNWNDEHGLEIDPDEPVVYERLTYSLPMLIMANSESEYWSRLHAFFQFILNLNVLTIDIPSRNRRFIVQHLGFSNYNDYVESHFSTFNWELGNDRPNEFLAIP